VQIRELAIADAYEIVPQQHRDDRGVFLEWYRFDRLAEAVGHPLTLRQGNLSVSRRGVLRGVHFADTPPGQAKYVTVVRGAARDYVVDLRVGSPTFGRWDAVDLDDERRNAVYLAEGLGHAFLALADDTVVSYLVSGVYDPAHEHGVSPLDPALGLEFPIATEDLVLSDKDRDAPTLAELQAAGGLPDHAALRGFTRALDEAAR
jgi:dTDP-4-dehydrorhamnose 3,5-epimerase